MLSLKEFRVERGLTQTEVARKANVSVGLISMVETGKHIPGPVARKKLMHGYRITPEKLTKMLRKTKKEAK